MIRKRLWSGLLVSAMAAVLAATPALAAEVEAEEEYAAELSVDLTEESADGGVLQADEQTGDFSAETDPGETVQEETVEAVPEEDSQAETVPEETVPEEVLPDEKGETDEQMMEGSVAVFSVAGSAFSEEDSAEEGSDAVESDAEDSEEKEFMDAEYGIAALAKADDTSVSDGFHQDADSGDWYYYTDGQIDTGLNSVVKGTVNGESDWWYVVGGKVQLQFTGLADYSNASGWWYVTDGRVDRTVTTVAKNKNGWYYVKDGKVDRSYTGFATNENGAWYMVKGKLTRSQYTVIRDTNGALGSTSDWYYVVGGKVQSDYTGLANYKNDSGWWYVTDGRVDRSVTTVAKNKNGWYYVKNGKVNRSYTGFATNENGSWYMVNGKLSRSQNTVIKDTNGALGSKSDWYYVVGGKVQSDFTGLANYKNDSGWWYITNGKVDRTFTGVAENKNGTYYIKNGKVQHGFTDTVTVDGETYSVVNGKATLIDPEPESDTDSESDPEDDSEFTLSPEDISYAGKDTTQLETPVFYGTLDDRNGTMTITWDAVPGAEKYRVFRREYGDSSWTQLTDTTATSYTDHLWNESKVYYYTVRCVSADGAEYMSDYIKGFSGSAVAAYAQQFVGNPYVYGGSSLTNGCDCSGFVMLVYAHFGVYLPHSSSVQVTLGQAVSDADIQPGDIVGRSGHTSLYIGNGQIVHAQDSAHGICISELGSSSYTSIRRIF